MPLILDDRIKETSATTGTGTLDLDGAVTGFQTFVAGVGDGNTTYYAIVHRTSGEWEVGIGTITDAVPDTLARNTVLTSSNGDAAVNFSAGTMDVFVTLPASRRGEFDHVAIENDDHAVEIRTDAAGFGDVKALEINYITGDISSGEDQAVILVDVDEINATGGDIFGLEVLSTDGGADNIYGMKVGAVIAPILQESGSFANPTTGTNDTTSTDVAAMIDGSVGTNTTIFVADDDYILIGAAAPFTEIEFIIETPAPNPGVKPTFGYSIAGSHLFTTFSPVDGTDGFKHTGVVAWDADDLTSHAVNTDTGTFDIKIIRTHASAGSVSLFYAKTAATVVYSWDKNGNISVANIKANDNGVLEGDGTAGRVLRKLRLDISDGTNATTIKCSTNVNVFWNHIAISAEDNLGKSGDTGNFVLDAGGSFLTIQASGLEGNAKTFTATVAQNFSGTSLVVRSGTSSTDIILGFANAVSGAVVDLTTLVDSGSIVIEILYITDG